MSSSRARRSRSATRSRGRNYDLGHGDVVIAAITSCTNTSNPSVMIAAGLVARNAVAKGLSVKPWVKTSLAPGSQVVAGLSQGSRSAEVARQARLQHRRLRLHDLHRQFRPARAGDVGDHRQARSRRRGGALGQSQLRGPRQSGRARQLSRLAAARRRLCARRLDAGRPDPRSDRQGQAGQARLSRRHLAEDRRGAGPRRVDHHRQDVQDEIRERVRRRRELAQGQGAGRPHLRLGHGLDLCAEPALFRRPDQDADAGRRHRQRPHPGALPRFHHHRPHLARGLDQGREPGGRISHRASGPPGRLQPVRHPARQPRSDDARHLRQHPHQEPDGEGRGRRRGRGRLHAASTLGRAHGDL